MQRHGYGDLQARNNLTPRFWAHVTASRQRIFNREYHRDKDGKFASGGGGVRSVLSGAGNIEDLNAAASGEIKRITGRDVKVDMTGANLQIAKEQTEGILQGFERFPQVGLVGVHTYGPGSAKTNQGPEIARLHPEASAVTQAHGMVENGTLVMKSNIYFNTDTGDSETYRADRQQALDEGFLVTGTPTGTALHEFGHALANHTGATRDAYDAAVALADKAGAAPTPYIAKNVSGYATENMKEFAAEAFADVMSHGSSASPVSHAAFDVLSMAYDKLTPKASNRAPTFWARVAYDRQRRAS